MRLGPIGGHLTDLKVELEVVHADDGVPAVDFDRHRLTVLAGSERSLKCAHVECLLTFRRPTNQLGAVFRVSFERSGQIAVDERSIGSLHDINDDMVFVDQKGDFLRGGKGFEHGL